MGFGAKPSTGFGSTGGGLFGQQGNQQQQGGGLFGGGAQQNQQQQQQGGGLFGAKPSGSTSMFGQSGGTGTNTGGGLFGGQTNNNAGASGGGGLFGAKPAAGGGLFGGNTGTTGTTGGGLFGQQNAQQQPQQQGGSGLFGSKPAGTTGGGLFGGGAQQSGTTGGGLFGQQQQQQPQQQQSGGLFGGSNTGGGLFGSKPTGNAPSGGGLFGNNTQQGGTTSGGLFGGGSSNVGGTTGGGGLFGSNQSATGGTGGFGTGGGLFGGGGVNANAQQQQQPQQQQQQQQQQLGQPLFLQKTQQQQTQPLANINSQDPYGQNPLFQSISGATPQQQTQGFGGDQKPRATVLRRSFAIPHQNKKVVTLGNTAQRITPLFKVSVLPSSTGSKPVEKVQDELFKQKSDSIFTPVTDLAIITLDIFRSNNNFKKLVVEKSSGGKYNLAINDGEGANGGDGSSSPTKQVSFVLDGDKKKKELDGEKEFTTKASKDKSEAAVDSKNGKVVINGDDKNQTETETEAKGGTIAKRDEYEINEDGYWTSPPISQLQTKPLAELKSIPNFKIGRKGYGFLQFLEPVDLSTMLNMDDIFSLVEFDNKSCIVYPEDDLKPRKGEGLNLPATITLHNCWPLNKTDRLPILDPHSDVVKLHIENLQKLPGMKYVKYDPISGDWTFTVDEM